MPSKKDQPRRPVGRPTDMTPVLTDAILGRLADGESLRSICTDPTMPGRTTVMRWVRENTEFRNQYARAREAQAEAIFDDMIEIADDGSNDWMEKKNREGEVIGWAENGEAIRRSALRIDARKWMLARMAPKKYGDKVQIGGDADAGPIQVFIRRFSEDGDGPAA